MNEKHFVQEIKSFAFYSTVVWPVHRVLAKNVISPRCKKCIISSRYRALNVEGFCSDCVNAASGVKPIEIKASSSSAKLQEELSQILATHQGKGKLYDALVLFSGGKDSSYLVYKLRNDYPKLRLLLMTVDNTFMSPIAVNNLDAIVKKLDVAHFTFRPPAEVYDKMFRHAFLNLENKGCSAVVDQFDGDFFHDLARNYAAILEIPLLLSGCSKTQVERILKLNSFESPSGDEAKKRTHVAHIELESILQKDEMKYWWDGSQWPSQRRPRVIFPFYAWNLEETFIKDKVIEWGLISPGQNNPLLTNSQLVPLMALVDMCQQGYSSFEPEFSEMVRQGKADPVFWRNVFELSEYSARTGRFISKSVDQVLQRLKLTRQDLKLPL